MITKFKIFENKIDPKIGDYVICEEISSSIELKKFIDNNIGYIIDQLSFNRFTVQYNNVPKNLFIFFNEQMRSSSKCREMFLTEIQYWSKNKEELENILLTRKFNI